MAGGVVHFEIPADDENRAREFYRSVFGWGFEALPEMDYNMVMTTPMDEQGRPTVPGSINGGMFKREEGLTTPVVTVDVDDIDAVLEKITAQGGSTHREKVQVGAMGWNAYFKDCEGNIVGLWQSAAPEGGAGSAAAGNDIGA